MIIWDTGALVAAADDQYHSRCVELVEKYSDFPLGMVDASVFAVAERLGADAIATFDRRHFSVVRPKAPLFFTLLP